MADGRSRRVLWTLVRTLTFTLQKLLSTEVTCLTWVFNSFYLFIGCTGPSLMHEWPVGATIQLRCTGFSLQRLLLLSTGPRVQGFSRCTP